MPLRQAARSSSMLDCGFENECACRLKKGLRQVESEPECHAPQHLAHVHHLFQEEFKT
jgi:hypothetical protein